MLFQADLDRFWQTITNDDAEQRFAAAATLDDLLLCEVIRYGTYNKQGMIGPFAGLYRMLTTKMSEEGQVTNFDLAQCRILEENTSEDSTWSQPSTIVNA